MLNETRFLSVRFVRSFGLEEASYLDGICGREEKVRERGMTGFGQDGGYEQVSKEGVVYRSYV